MGNCILVMRLPRAFGYRSTFNDKKWTVLSK